MIALEYTEVLESLLLQVFVDKSKISIAVDTFPLISPPITYACVGFVKFWPYEVSTPEYVKSEQAVEQPQP